MVKRLAAVCLGIVLLLVAALLVAAGAFVTLGILALVVGSLVAARWAYVQAFGSAEINYRGEKVRLTRKCVDYDDYKDDPSNLHPSEIARVERMVADAPIRTEFADWKDFVAQAMQIKFPGYGLGPGPKVEAAWREFLVEKIEIPHATKDRYLVLEKMGDGSLRLVDDFVMRGHLHILKPVRRVGFGWKMFLALLVMLGAPKTFPVAAISSIRLVNDRLIYANREANIVRETSVARS